VPIRYLLDTNIVSLALKGLAPAAVARLAAVARDQVAISVVTAMELEYGLAKSPLTRHRLAVRGVLDVIPVLPLPEDVASTYGRVRAELEERGHPIGPLDTIIAAHALHVGAILVTENTREFRRVRGLKCESWSR
jgi:tRNA(fMet)-specific endonuclease VapC